MMLACDRWRSWSLLITLTLGSIALAASSSYSQERGSVELKNVDMTALNDTYEVTVRALNYRPEPTLSKPPASVVQEGDFLLKTGETFNQEEGINWLRVIRSDGLEGWVSERYLNPVKSALTSVEGAVGFLSALNPAAAPAVAAVNDVKVGFVYPAPIGDAGWAFSHDVGRQALERLPYVTKTSYIESVPEDPKLVTAALEELVADGNNLIFGTSYGYMDPMMEAAKRHPDVVFMHSSGFKTQPNAGTYFGRIYEARYLSGIVAGAMTESNEIGFVAAFPIPQVIRGINAFTLGAQSVNPNAKVEVVWTNTWYGPGIEREKAEALMDAGADVITIHQNSPAALQAAEQRGVYAIGYHSDMSAFAPRATLTSAIWDWRGLYQQIAADMTEGDWKPEQIWSGLDQGVVALAPISNQVPADVRSLVEQRRNEIGAGTLRIFEGPIRDANGEIRVGSGKILSDADLLTMDYYVLGVEGGVAPTMSTASDEDEGS